MSDNNQAGWFSLYMVFLIVSGINTSMAMMESFVAIIMDATKKKRIIIVAGVGALGIIVSAAFTTNFGWLLIDIVDHYVSSYIIIIVGLLQCIAVGWQFEQDSTQQRSDYHKKSSRILGLFFWFPVVVLNLYINISLDYTVVWGPLIFIPTTGLALFVSFKVSKMPFYQWYHEIALCGVNKVSMSITDLSNEKS